MPRPRRALLFGIACALALGAPGRARALDLPQRRSESLSGQFILFCDDHAASSRIADFAEELKHRLLEILGESDHWKYPVTINLARADTAHPARRASAVQAFQTDEGFKVEVAVSLGADPRDVHFSEQLVRALLLEMEYRATPAAIRGGAEYAAPPEWLVAGAVALFDSRDAGPDAGLFRSLIRADHLPKLTGFLAENPDGLDSASRRVHAHCAMCLVQLLAGLPEGRRSLAALVRDWPRANGDSFGELIKHFPVLGADSTSVEKWWTLGLARLAAADRYEGLSLEDTEVRLAALLSIEVPVNKAGERQKFGIGQFEQFRKIAAARPALLEVSARLLALGTEANALCRPVVYEYQEIAAGLARGKTRGVKARLDSLAKYRAALHGRVEDIADYLNWYEATQTARLSGAFEGYLRAAGAPDTTPKRGDALTRYLDAAEQQVQ